MPTYQYYAAARERASRRAATDAAMRERHRDFDLQAQDRTAKFERPQFAVVGEGTRAAQDLYRQNYDRIRWGDTVATPDLRPGAAPPRTRRVASSTHVRDLSLVASTGMDEDRP